MAWVDQSGAFGYGTILTSTQMQNLRDNLPEIASGGIFGLTLSNDTDTDHDIAIAIGICVDAVESDALALSSILTKQIDVDWVAGDDAGGFPSGLTLTASTWYHVFLIKNPTSGIVDAGFDSSITATNLLSDATGYTKYRRLGSILTDAGPDILAFQQKKDIFRLGIPILDVDVADQGTAYTARVLSVPPDVEVEAFGNVYVALASGPAVQIRPVGASDAAAGGVSSPLACAGAGGAGVTGVSGKWFCPTNISKQVETGAGAASTTVRITTEGWRDFF